MSKPIMSALAGLEEKKEMLQLFKRLVGKPFSTSARKGHEVAWSEAKKLTWDKHYAISNKMAEKIFRQFIFCLRDQGETEKAIDNAAREFARKLVLVMIAQRGLDEHVALPAGGFCGFLSPKEILSGEIYESEN